MDEGLKHKSLKRLIEEIKIQGCKALCITVSLDDRTVATFSPQILQSVPKPRMSRLLSVLLDLLESKTVSDPDLQ